MDPSKIDFKKLHGEQGKLIGLIIVLFTSFIFVLTPVWQLIILSGVLGGLFTKRGRDAALIGGLGVAIVWGLYLIVNVVVSAVEVLIEQIAGIIIGESGFGVVLTILIIIIGAGIGSLGGVIGFLIKDLFFPEAFERTSENLDASDKIKETESSEIIQEDSEA